MQLYTVYLYLETALHVLGVTFTHHQERIQLYLQRLVFITLFLLPAAIAAGSSSCLTYTIAVYTVLSSYDGRKDRLKHVEHFTRINNLR